MTATRMLSARFSWIVVAMIAVLGVWSRSCAWAQSAPRFATGGTTPVPPALPMPVTAASSTHALQGTWTGHVFKDGDAQPLPATLVHNDAGYPVWDVCGNKRDIVLTHVGKKVSFPLKGGGGSCTVRALEVGPRSVEFELEYYALQSRGELWSQSRIIYRRRVVLEHDGLHLTQTNTQHSSTDGMIRGGRSSLMMAGKNGHVETMVGILQRQ